MSRKYLGVELGSTRIKAVVIDETEAVLASGSFAWENQPLTETVWTYDLADARRGLAAAYAVCVDDYAAKFGSRPTRFDAMGVAEKILSDMLGIPVTTRATAGEGGAWGIAQLAKVRNESLSKVQ